MSQGIDKRDGVNPGEGPPEMAFLQYAIPPLQSGDFTVTVKQKVLVQGTECETFQASQAFSVAGERYGLGPADVDSLFPPAGNQGEFSNNLAHVVFTSPTLPWQRSPNPSASKPVAGKPVPTWLGVLLFDQNDPPPAPRHVTLAELVTKTNTYFPPRVPERGENPTDPVTVIDIPITLFNAIAPSLADLNWTAHVRTVDPVAKGAGGGAPPAVDFSVVIGNRLPVSGNTATVHLVSFEGYGPYLPANDGTPSTAIPAGTAAVRMVTLRSWSFTAFDLKQTFAELLTHVNLTPSSLQLPYDSTNATGKSVADTTVRNAFGLGYTAMNHNLRDGSSTVSWYRGPLLPLAIPVPPTTKPTSPAGTLWADADVLQRYDPTNGMFDPSYSAAWQLGRLLALHDSAFATALYRWKLTQTQAKISAMEQQIIDQELPVMVQPVSAAPGAGVVDASLPERLAASPAVVENARYARISAVIKRLVGPAAAQLRALSTEDES
jgi:hypothetical protein